MEEITRGTKPVKKNKFDESKLIPEHQWLLELAKAQGAPMTRKLEDMYPDLDPKDADQLVKTIEEIRGHDREAAKKAIF
jgi:hypothetical protein